MEVFWDNITPGNAFHNLLSIDCMKSHNRHEKARKFAELLTRDKKRHKHAGTKLTTRNKGVCNEATHETKKVNTIRL